MSEQKIPRKLWFYYANSLVYGPFDDTEIKVRLSNMPYKEGVQIWRLGARNTLRFSEWIEESSNVAQALRGKTVRILIGRGLAAGPFEPFEAVEYLRELNTLEDTFMRIEGRFDEWVPVQSLEQVINILRADVRKLPRLSCDGEVFLSSAEFNCKARLMDLSMAGFRCTLISGKTQDESKIPVLGSMQITGADETIYFQAQLKNKSSAEMGLKFLALEQRYADLIESYLAFMFRRQATEAFLTLSPTEAQRKTG